ncbi:MAG: AbrB family transcriptional regulator [Rhodobacteraceae bacterium]|nr:AbrB family transcriptional regulator [Paracoccaceae bacterium]
MRILFQTIAVGGLGAALAWFLGVPAPFLTGPASFVSVAGLLGLKTVMPDRLRDTVFLVIGLVLGTSVTPEILDEAGKWPISLIAMSISVALIMVLGGWMFKRWFGMDRQTGLLAATPGHLSYVLSFSTDIGANTAIVSVIQSMRILILTLLVPVAIAVFTDADMTMRAPYGADISVANLLILAVLAFVLGRILLKLQVPAAYLLGGMILSSVGHGAGLTPGNLPVWLSSAAFIMMGTLIGTRFSGVSKKMLREAAFAGIAITFVGLSLAILTAMLVSQLTGLPLIWLIIALAPGGLETMVAMAGVVGADPAFVAFHHVARLFFLSAFVPLVLMSKSAHR